MLLDANVLLAAIDLGNPDRDRVAAWLKDALEGPRRIAIPWQTIGAFVRIATHPRVFRDPLSHDQALNFINACLASPVTWVPAASERTVVLFNQLCRAHQVTGNLVTDGQLVALAVEYGLSVVSLDSDFLRFPEIPTVKP